MNYKRINTTPNGLWPSFIVGDYKIAVLQKQFKHSNRPI